MVPDRLPDRVQTFALLLVTGVALAGLAGGVSAQSDSTSLTTTNETVRLHATADATVHGTTDLSEGTELTVRLRTAGETQPRKLASETATVGADGSFSATFNLSAYSPGDRFSVTVVRDGETVASSDATVVAADVSVTPGGESSRRLPGFGAAAAALALALVGALHRRTQP